MALEVWSLKVRPDFVHGSQRSTAILMIVSSGGFSVVPEKLTKRRLYGRAHCSGSAREVERLAVRAVTQIEAFAVVVSAKMQRIRADGDGHGFEALLLMKSRAFSMQRGSHIVFQRHGGEHNDGIRRGFQFKRSSKVSPEALIGLD